MDLDTTKMTCFSLLLVVFVMCNKPHNSIAAGDSISAGETLSGFETITSKGGRFMMGFFTPGESRNYYIGIWYNYRTALVRTVVWVANRDKPLSGSSSSQLKLSENGNLVLHESKSLIWSTNLATNTLNKTEVVLGDDGNLVLRDGSNPSVVYWQSFDYPTNTWLPGGKIGINKKTNETQTLTSWRNQEDPAMGIFSLEFDPTGISQYLIKWNKSKDYWTSGEWDETARTFTSVPEMRSNYIYNFSYISNENESYFTYNLYNSSILSIFVMDVSGQIKQFTWSYSTEKLNLFCCQPKQLCDVYGICGPFGNCNQNTSKCECLPGFVERSPSDWNLLDSTGGCLRNKSFRCGGTKDVFSPIPTSKLPDDPRSQEVNSAGECKSACQSRCSCNAYAYGNTGCQLWEGDMLNTKNQSDGRAGNLYLRLAASEIHNDAIATNNFCFKNKLGEGGFGPVYKGKLQNGQQIAVKRLSKSSGQGIEEFKNEVVLISKLQHRNLVKLLGCCVEGEEKMLIYEYMPNKSLDAFLFDSRNKLCLDWDKRFNIIGGIARGLLYLHRDSRLRVIHRDLKVSNILLDEDMIPKISDFGMARIFGGNQAIDNTNRVVGTIGYMCPEYMIGGTFSEKSDVFSFGVLVLEVVSGKRNNSFYNPEQPLNLLVHAWRLWNEGKWLEVVDEALVDSYSPNEVMKCIHIGLLCGQHRAIDRPTMAEVDHMLNYETDRPSPKEPPYTFPASTDKPIHCSNNNVTLTTVVGR